MAKTFKNLPSPETAGTAKRASERDFFDLTEDSQPATPIQELPLVDAIPAVIAELGNPDNTHHINNRGNIHNTGNSSTKKRVVTTNRISNSSNSGNIDNINNTSNTHPSVFLPADDLNDQVGTVPVVPSRDVRQTFVLGQAYLEQLRDHVHARRIGGDYNYSQKQALQEALDLLFASTAPVSPRPEQVRELEQQRRERIQRGKQFQK